MTLNQNNVNLILERLLEDVGGRMQGRIIQNIANLYQIKTKQGVYEASARGKLKQEELLPVVGDLVEIEIIDQENKKAVIEEIKPRQNYSKRPKISNLTQVILVLSSKDPKPDLLMLDKQLAYAEFQKITPILIFNKMDLDQKNGLEEIKKIYQKIGYLVFETEAKNKKGIQEIKKILKNNINAFSGNSGVGKSTLINALFEKELTEEGEISKKNKRGKNTTTAIQLYEIDQDTYIADTPGFSTFALSEIESPNLENYFREFKEEIKNCEYVGCSHQKEQICGIKRAIEEGRISKGRYERYCKIYQELKEREDRKW